MNGTFILEDAKILNLVPQTSQDKKTGNTINWFEVVAMQGANINTITCDQSVYSDLVVGEEYSLVLSVQEVLKASGDKVYKNHKFKIIDYIPFQSEN